MIVQLPFTIKKLMSSQKTMYLVVGGSAFVFEYLIFYCTESINLFFAQTVSFLIGATISFLGNRYFVFMDERAYDKSHTQQGLMYIVLVCANLVISNFIIGVLTFFFFVSPLIAKIITIAIIVVWNFIIYRFIIFNKNVDKEVS